MRVQPSGQVRLPDRIFAKPKFRCILDWAELQPTERRPRFPKAHSPKTAGMQRTFVGSKAGWMHKIAPLQQTSKVHEKSSGRIERCREVATMPERDLHTAAISTFSQVADSARSAPPGLPWLSKELIDDRNPLEIGQLERIKAMLMYRGSCAQNTSGTTTILIPSSISL